MTPQQTGVQFNNSINPTDEMNILDFHYLYNGGGVGIADFNNDGLPDILFGGNQVSSALYINKGNFQFELSDAIQTNVWVNGISIVDINYDGLKDVYLNVGGANCEEGECKNRMLINTSTKDKIEFEEQDIGLAVDLYSQQTVFFDADRDGDLDAYVLQNYVDPTGKNYPKPKRYFSKKSYDKFYLNQEVETGILFFKDVSEARNVNHSGFGLGVVLTDVNNDGYLDVYVANDFISDDLFYINNEGKSFTESSKQLLKHTSYNSMGVDAADLNNDGFEEIMVVDMLPYTNARQKTMLGMMNYDKYKLSLKENFNSQYIRNTLQKHNRTNRQNEALPFTEIGAYSNIYQTDWSWAPLFADFNNDSKIDLYITNGYASNITDLDFVNYNNQNNPFGDETNIKKEILQNLEKQGAVTLNNAYFENTGSFNFVNQTKNHFNNNPSLSNGAAYADLDLDGDLDLVVNNINQPAFIIENNTEGNYLTVDLKSDGLNKDAIGAKVSIWSNGIMQTKTVSPIRGYLSSIESKVHFGLDSIGQVDSLVVKWTKGTTVKKNVKGNQILSIHEDSQNWLLSPNFLGLETGFFLKDTLVKRELIYHQSHDFSIQPLLVRQYSNHGFQITKSSFNSKKKWFFVGGPKGVASTIYDHSISGNSQIVQILNDTEKSVFDAVFFDYDKDGDEDLYVAYGGYLQPKNHESYIDVIYVNDEGVFNKADLVRLENFASSCIAANDYDKDGDVDFFIGSQVVPQNYPEIPASVFLQNQGGLFKNIIEDALGKANLGLIQDAIWTDINGDGWQDLIIVGEWMSPLIFINKEGKLSQQKNQTISNLKGLWRCVYAIDIDHDGDQDLVLGNFGTNSRLKASANQPIQLVVGDLDKNGKYDPLMSFYGEDEKGKLQSFPYHTRDDIANQLPIIKSKYKNYSDYGEATFEEVLSHFDQETYKVNEVNTLESVVLENHGNLEFEVHFLPDELQWSPINEISSVTQMFFNSNDPVQLYFGMNDNSLDTHTGKLDGQAVLKLNIKSDFTFEMRSNTNIGGHETVRSLIHIGNKIFVGDDEKITVYESIF